MNSFEQFLYNIHFQIINPSMLNPTVLSEKVQPLSGTGYEERILTMIRQGIYQNSNQRSIIKYIHLVDKLLKFSTFNVIMQQGYLLDFYCDIFVFLLMQKCNNQIEQIKIVRKYWVRKVHPLVLNKMRDVILSKTGIDVDGGFKEEHIKNIKEFYTKQLKLTPQEIKFCLPKISKGGEEFRAIPRGFNTQIPTYSGYPLQPAYNMQRQTQPLFVGQQPLMGRQERKKSLASQETKLSQFIDDVEGSEPKKMIHKNQVFIDYKAMLSQLKCLSLLKCKECGLAFTTSQAYQNHIKEHFRQKIKKIDKTKRPKKNTFITKKQWVGKQQISDYNLKTFYVSLSNVDESTEHVCEFCHQMLDIQFKNDNWILVNTTNALIDGQMALIHKSCQLALEQSSQQQAK